MPVFPLVIYNGNNNINNIQINNKNIISINNHICTGPERSELSVQWSDLGAWHKQVSSAFGPV